MTIMHCRAALLPVLIGVLLLAIGPDTRANERETWARIHTESLPAWLDEERAIDYGAFFWAPVADPARAMLGAGSLQYELRDRAFELELGGTRFDPLIDGLPASSMAADQPITDGPDWRLVQFRGPIRAAWLAGLRAQGVEPVQYIHPHTYVVWSNTTAMQAVSRLAAVRWHGAFPPEFRFPPIFHRQGSETIEVTLMFRSGMDATLSAAARAGAEVIDSGALDRQFDVATVRTRADRLAELARIPGVYSVQPVPTDGGTRSEMSVQINHENVDGSGAALPGYLDFLDNLGLDGTGVTLAVVDNGTQVDHPDIADRMLPCSAPSCGNGTQTDGHGTHVAGIMVADGASGSENADGFLRGLGMAPGAGLVEQRNNSVGTPWLLNLMRDSVRNGASISNNSWGPSGTPQGYDNHTRQVDVGVRDADTDEPGDQPLTYVLAFMNGFGGTGSQGSPDEAKNVFTIGSAWAQSDSDTQDMRNDEISVNSAHGPALDGRFIPHMIANSRFTDSTLGGSGYGLQGGTSQAAPHVAGAAALFTEHYRNVWKSEPSPALIKAAFLAQTRDLEGSNDADDNPIGARPTSTQGWGRMHLGPLLSPTLPVFYLDQSHVFTDTGQTWQRTFHAADPEEPMKLMLVWTDAPGHGLGGSTPAWNNDLDLRVTAGTDLYLGNVFDSGWSATGGSADGRNNTEGTYLQPAQHQGSITVEILAADINSNALPNAGENNSQDFALACVNCTTGSNGADLGIGLTAVPASVEPGETATWVAQVANFGPDAALDPTITLSLPPEAAYVNHRTLGGTVPEWTCTESTGTVECELSASIAASEMAPSLEVETTVSASAIPGPIMATAQVSSTVTDPVGGNNAATETVEVVDPPADDVFRDAFEAASR